MALWRLRPVAEAQDPWWQNRRIWREAVVRAASPAEARLVAATLEADPTEPLSGNESPDFRSGFLDEKLYRVDRLDRVDDAPEAGPAVLNAVEAPRAVLPET